MIGFEAELQVPTFRQEKWPDEADSTYFFLVNANIYSFLFCGYEDTKTVVSSTERFLKIKPDVADYAVEGKLLFAALSDFLQIANENRFLNEPRMTKLEYETFPINEAAADSDKTYLAQAASIKNHAAKFAVKAQNEIVEVPDTRKTEGTSASTETGLIGQDPYGMYAGVPVQDIEGIIAGDKPKASAINELLQKIRAKVKPEFAIQATAGIFPSAIPQLFENPQKPLDRPFTPKLREAWETAYPLICKSVAEVMNDETFRNHEWVQANLNEDVRRQAFKGYLYLLCSYLVGDALSQTALFEKMSAKNAVPYHAKINLGNFYKAMPGKGGPKPPADLAAWIAKKLTGEMPRGYEEFDAEEPAAEDLASKEPAKRKIANFMTTEFWLAELKVKKNPFKEHLVYNAPDDFVFKAITRERVATFINQLGRDSGEPLTANLGEKRVVDEHRDPDAEPRNRDGERGVQLEFRRLGAEGVSLDGVEAVFMNVINEVRKLNGPYAS